MTSDSSGIRVKRVSPDEPVSAPGTEQVAPPARPRTGLQDRLSTAGARETKPFYLTSEFLVAAVTVLALLFAGYLHDDSLNTWRTWLLVSVVASAYVLSRGIAKAGSSDRR